jgi:hypothetical protein
VKPPLAIKTAPRPAVRSRNPADMPGRGVALAAAVPAADRLRAGDLAQLEECSLRTAQRLMASGALGPVRGRSRRDRWIARPGYLAWCATL